MFLVRRRRPPQSEKILQNWDHRHCQQHHLPCWIRVQHLHQWIMSHLLEGIIDINSTKYVYV